MVAPIRFLSGRQQEQKIGIEGSTEEKKVLEVVGRVGVGTTIFNPTTELEVRGSLTATTYYGEGGALSLGNSSDGDLVTPGALNTITEASSIVNTIDDLNELAFNIIKNTVVTDVDFSSAPTAGGDPLTVSLSVTSSGNANRYDVDWGDGNVTLDYSSSTIPHTYDTSGDGGLFSVQVTARNNTGVGAGSSFTISKDGYITVYTPDPVVTFELYRTSSGGSALTGNDLYVVEGQDLYMQNNTTNTTAVGMVVDYTMAWRDGTPNDSIANNAADGGVSGNRLLHSWAEGTSTSTSRDTLILTLNNHNTADPAVIPTSGTVQLKVYDDAPAAPDGLSTKTLANVSSTGVNPKLASGFTDNVSGGTSLTAGDSVNRVTSGTATAQIQSYAYTADDGVLTARVNNVADGFVQFTIANETGTYTSLVVNSESDYQLLNPNGTNTTFANSIYYPGLYKGFLASVSKTVLSLPVGANSMQLLHSITGNTNIVEFVKDDLDSSPGTSVALATLAENVGGTKRYISGIPYYNTGSPSLTLSGVEISDLIGQCYSDVSNPVEVDPGTPQEGTSSAAIDNTDYTYSDIDGASSMLTGGIPNINIGTGGTPYAIGDLTVPITTANVRTISRIKVRSRNVDGIGSYTADIPINIQVHRASQSGISEIAIPVSDSLGNGTFTDDGVRIFDLSASTTNTPSFNGATNFYTNNPYNELTAFGVVGTQEATIRLGVLKHDLTDYSSGYLPVGPNRSGDTGTQYFTFAFRRQAVAGFDINITSSSISGLWIAAPGTQIDSTSGLNGWLRADQVYNGSGVPGSNVGNGGNGSDGCAATSGDVISASTSLSGSYTMTLGTENMSNSTGNVVLIRIALASGQSVTSLSIS